MGKVVGVVVGVVEIAVGLLTGNIGLIISGTLQVGATLAAPSMKQQQRQASVTSLQIGEVAREAVLGEALTGGSLVDGFNYGGKYGTDWEVLVIALADHECQALLGFYVNDKYVAFAGDGPVTGYNGQLEVYWRPGTATQSVPSILTSHGPGWTVNDRGVGVSHVTVAYLADKSDAKNPIWPGGRPRFRWHLRGAKCYSARNDSTVAGGSGSSRRDDPATWTWTENPIDCRYAWVRGFFACNRMDDPGMLLVGRGLTAIEAPPENVAAAANLCDEIVGAEKRYQIGGVVRADDSYIATEEMFASSCGGVIIQPKGSVEIEPGQAKTPVAFITDADLVVGSRVDFSHYLSRADREWVNTLIPRYIEPSQAWSDHAAPIRRNPADLVTDKGPREATVSLLLVHWLAQAGRVGEIMLRLGRLWKRAGITLIPDYCEIEEGDWIVWTSQRYLQGGSATFRVESYRLDEKWQNQLRLRQISGAVYSDGDFLEDLAEANQLEAPPSIGAPDPGSWTLSAEDLSAGAGTIPALIITGAVDDDYAQSIRFEYWLSDGVTDPEAVTFWNGMEVAAPSTTRREITSIAPRGVYYAAVSYAVSGVPGDRLILGPVTVGDLVSDSGLPAQMLKDDFFVSSFWTVPAPAGRIVWAGSRTGYAATVPFQASTDFRIVYSSSLTSLPRSTAGKQLYVRVLADPSGFAGVQVVDDDGTPIVDDDGAYVVDADSATFDLELAIRWLNSDGSFNSRSVVATASPTGGVQTITGAAAAPVTGFGVIEFGYPSQTSKTGAWTVYEPWEAEYQPAADVTATAQIIVTNPTAIDISADYTGTITGALPRDVAPTVTRGGADIRTANSTTYAIQNATGGCVGNVTVNNTAGSDAKGLQTIGTGFNASGGYDLVVTVNGVQQPANKVTVTKSVAAAPAGGGSSGGGGGTTGASGSFDVTGYTLASTSFVEIGRVSNLAKAAGQTIRAYFSADYRVYSGGAGRTVTAKWQYSVAGANSWTDFAAAVTGTPAYYNNVDSEAVVGSVTCNQTAAPANGSYDIRLIALRTGGTFGPTFDAAPASVQIGT